MASRLLDLTLFLLPRLDKSGSTARKLEDDDSLSDAWEELSAVQGLNWYHDYYKDQIIPFKVL
jgi:hypothetical protein